MQVITTDTDFFDSENLAKLAAKYHQEYVEAKPFPYIVIDNFLPENLVASVLTEFPSPEQVNWKLHKHKHSLKLATNKWREMQPQTQDLFYQLNSSAFVSFLEELTGINGLIPDPHLEGGGLHQIQKGGFLGVHADFNIHPRLKLDRRLNLLLYLNQNWQEEWGGHLELWNQEMTHCEKKILPIFNRCVIFNTTDFSFHGHPEPLNCPPDRTRKSLALYYYSNGRPAAELSEEHSTLYQLRPQEKLDTPKKSTKTKVKTESKSPKLNATIKPPKTLKKTKKNPAKEVVKLLTPPLLLVAAKKLIKKD